MLIFDGNNGIDMADKPITNLLDPVDNKDAVNREYVDSLKTIATGTATFNATTNNINLTGIGIRVEIGDVIQISGAEDAKNNSEFTVEVITDNNNIIVNQAHANKGTSKNVANRASDTGVTVKLLAKWYNAPIGLGQDWVDVTSSRVLGVGYINSTKRSIVVSACGTTQNGNFVSALYINNKEISSFLIDQVQNGVMRATHTAEVPKNSGYFVNFFLSHIFWYELR